MKLLRYLSPVTTLSLLTVISLASITTATAQIIPDSSLGAESSIVTPDVVNSIPSDRINGGATRGSNLFHSFQEFNVGEGRGAYFSNPTNITNILTRVTGGNPSNILGRLGVLGNANLFLINPKGIFFGPNASLDLDGGSFFGSTADSVLFDNFEFSASNPQPVPQLTINIPIGLRFRDNPASINSNASLAVQTGKSLALVGGDINLNGGTSGTLEGRVELGGLAQAGTVGFNPDGSLSFPNSVTRGNVTLTNGARVGAIGQKASIVVNAQNLDISSGGGLFAGIPADANSDVQAGDIVINATDRVRLEGDSNSESVILNSSLASTGSPGDIVINTRSLEATGRFFIGSTTSGQGNAGNVTITATDKVSLQGLAGFNSGILTPVGQSATGKAGNIVINTRALSVSDSVSLTTSSLGQGNGGNIEINAFDSVSLSGSNSFFSALASSSGNAGNIIINTPSLSVSNGFGINTSTFGQGNAGNIIFNASDSVSVNSASYLLASTSSSGNAGDIIIDAPNANVSFNGAGTFASASVNSSSNGQGGDIKINARALSVSNSVFLSTFTAGQGNAGNIIINASDSVSVNSASSLLANTSSSGNAGNIIIDAPNANVSFDGAGTFASASVLNSSNGQGGDIKINARTLSVSDSVFLATSTAGQGNAGNIIINASDSVSVNSASFLLASTSSSGNAGNIIINASDSVSVNSASFLLAPTFSSGNAGNIIINAPNANVSFDGAGTFATTSVFGESNFSGVNIFGTGQGGDIKINARTLSLTNGAALSTVTSGFEGANAGDIEVNTSDFVNIDNSVLVSRSFGEGNAGNINITGGSVSLTNGGQLLAETNNKGNAGNITINAPTGTVSFDGTNNAGFASSVFTTVNSGAVGKGGDISITARSLSLTNGGQLNTYVNGASDTEPGGIGNAGNVKLNISDTTRIVGKSNIPNSNGIFNSSGIDSNVGSGAIGNAGNIEITTGSLFVRGGSQLNSVTEGKGNAGNVTINAPTGTVSFDGTNNEGFPSGIFTIVEAGGEGKGGDINITARSLSLTNGGRLNTFIRGNSDTQPGGIGDAGNVKLNITDTINITGVSDKPLFNGNFSRSGILSEVRDGARGNAGNIEITTGSLFVTNGGEIVSSTSGQGNAGGIKINANSFVLDAAQLNTDSNIENRQAGNIDITTTKDIRLNNGALISAQTQGGQGDIFLSSRDLILRRNSNITTNATGTAAGGNITIDTGNLVALGNSDISANSQSSFGGRVFITADAIFGTQFREQLTPKSDITATGASPDFSGTVQIDTADVDPSQGLVELPDNLADVSNQIAQNPCQKGTGSSFVSIGRGGVPSSPNDEFSSDNVRVDLVNPAPTNSNSQAATTNQPLIVTNTKKPIIPAQGWIFNSKGEVVLTAYDPTNISTAQRSSKPTAACPAF